MSKIYSKKETLALFIIWGIFIYLIFNNITRILTDIGFLVGTIIDVSSNMITIIEIITRAIVLILYILIGVYILKSNKETINSESKAIPLSLKNLKLTAMIFAISFVLNIIITEFKGSAMATYMVEQNIKYGDLFAYYGQINGIFNFFEMLTILTVFIIIIYRKGNP